MFVLQRDTNNLFSEPQLGPLPVLVRLVGRETCETCETMDIVLKTPASVSEKKKTKTAGDQEGILEEWPKDSRCLVWKRGGLVSPGLVHNRTAVVNLAVVLRTDLSTALASHSLIFTKTL